ncbi:PREDICTED: mitochondrial cardiolipin hydrolase, partial [Acanthisitta chloris]|uniref:mitochondrial cardiolipin hydrolase n=1 Tax=Acanthisitta chloris TaxID=57068 RepID=UPI0004F0EB89
IQVRHDQDGGYMHHKFAISNRENVMVLEDAEYVKAFLEEFERIWEEYNPVNYSFFPQRQCK